MDLGSPSLFYERSFTQIGRANHFLMQARQLQVSQRCLQILLQTRHGAGELALVILDQLLDTLHAAGMISCITHILLEPA